MIILSCLMVNNFCMYKSFFKILLKHPSVLFKHTFKKFEFVPLYNKNPNLMLENWKTFVFLKITLNHI